MMALLHNKWFLFSFLALLAILLAALLSKKSVHTDLVISAAPEEIWSVLMDAQGYAEWNPVVVKVEGEFLEGEKLQITVKEPDGPEVVMTPVVKKLVQNRELNQFGGIPGILTYDHKFLLEPKENGTQVTQYEVYRGIGVWFWDESWVEPAYAQVNEALGDRVAKLEDGQE